MMPQVVVPGLKKRDVLMSEMPGVGRRMSLGIPPELFEIGAGTADAPSQASNQ